MIAFCYNVGSGKTRGSSIVRKINLDDRLGAANAFLLWNRMNGVVMQALATQKTSASELTEIRRILDEVERGDR